jgi:alkylated DNA repair dioxygenase AlkB
LPYSASGFEYRPEFISGEEERALLAIIAGLPFAEAHYKEFTAKRRIVVFESGAPEFLHPLRERIAAWLGVPQAGFVHALVSEYRPGTGVGWHRDMPDFAIVAGVSLAAEARMRFRPYPPRKDGGRAALSLELEPRSAYVLRNNVRWHWQHSISPTRALRYSITFRTLLEP